MSLWRSDKFLLTLSVNERGIKKWSVADKYCSSFWSSIGEKIGLRRESKPEMSCTYSRIITEKCVITEKYYWKELFLILILYQNTARVEKFVSAGNRSWLCNCNIQHSKDNATQKLLWSIIHSSVIYLYSSCVGWVKCGQGIYRQKSQLLSNGIAFVMLALQERAQEE